MLRTVKCKYCEKEFYREHEEYVKVSTRYAHKECYEKEQKKNADYKKVTDLIQSLYYPQEPDWKMLGSQLKRYHDEGMTYMGIYYTLTYFFVIQKNDIHSGKGIGIIPYVYNKAKAYYKNQDNTYTKTAEIENTEQLNIERKEDIITITHSKPKKRLMDFNYE